MLQKVALPAKTFAVAVVTLLGAGAAQAALLAAGWPLALALGLPLLFACAPAALFAAYILRHRVRPLMNAFARMAQGDFDVEVPPAPDPELDVVRLAFVRMLDALEQKSRQLREADAQRRRLFADLAHELATPTSSLIGIGEALGDPAAPGDARARLLGHLDHEGARLERLIVDIRALAHLEHPEFRLDRRPAELAQLVEQAVDRAQLGPGAAIRCRATPVTATVNAVRLDQVLTNLLANARRHTPPDGSIEVELGARDGAARLVIEDTGSGVPDELLPRLGERMLRTDASRTRATGGHGLGLAIVAAIVEKHGGQLTFLKGQAGGLRVEIELPG